MEVRCHHCGHAFRVPGDVFGKHEKANLACPSCKRGLQIVNPKMTTFRPGRTDRKVTPITPAVAEDGRLLRLPENEDVSLRILEGEEKGTVYPVTKPRITIGRSNADIMVNDRMVSRVHCALEISDEGVRLRDLESTNGTLVDNQPISTALLGNGAAFRIGNHVFQLVISPKEP